MTGGAGKGRKMKIDESEKQINCNRCELFQGTLKFDGQIFQVGNLEFYNSVRFSCANCHYPKTFFPSELKDETKSLGKDTRKVLIDLGKDRKTKKIIGE